MNGLGYTPKLDVDGDWGPNTEAGVKWLQRKVGADVDGQWGERDGAPLPLLHEDVTRQTRLRGARDG